MTSPEEAPQSGQCPFCKEQINPEAVRCKHCHATIVAAKPGHHGVCPYCKESIHPEAVRCKHCHANLLSSGDCGCGQESSASTTRAVRSRLTGGGTSGQRKALARAAGRVDVAREPFPYPDPVPGCAATDRDEDGLWCYIEASEHYCIYELCVPAIGPTLPT